ncbi:uncharacterized protein LOC123886338 [Trifolium pratense]|uniref:uncharacterized protein LOC123886338 n=1 Tax=Trifolium pratense TaxID=57577 RepID=UPI001E695C8B|nr:uncharacterized protein LOC123886338 [Trifolium pratense]
MNEEHDTAFTLYGESETAPDLAPISLRSPPHCDLAPISFSLQSRSGLAPFTISLRHGLDSLRSISPSLYKLLFVFYPSRGCYSSLKFDVLLCFFSDCSACENALRCIGNNDVQKLGRSVFPENLKATTISEITRLRNVAMTSITSRSVVDERTIQMPVSLQQETDTLLQWSDTKVEKAGERIFRVGSVRYIMDPSRQTLQRISG